MATQIIENDKHYASKNSLDFAVKKTKEMVDQFNYQVIDLRNQIDTTDTYIENYLPFRTLKEVSQLLENSFDRSVNHKIKAFEAERIKELYARMI